MVRDWDSWGKSLTRERRAGLVVGVVVATLVAGGGGSGAISIALAVVLAFLFGAVAYQITWRVLAWKHRRADDDDRD